ncbi:MAG: DUF4363 family protein [Clostridiales bacterium]|jgi:hypothetical protein|nr:DUF4363 family protein [Eubacteriales bacterium]MDH7565825.1 DUF4363 family protein [Clostridiales bacterium]
MYTGKVVTWVTVLLVLIIGSGIYMNKSLEQTSKRLESNIMQIEDAAKSNDWEKARQHLGSIKTSWGKSQKSWTMLIDHTEIDNIDDTLTRLEGFIDSENTPLTLGEAASLRQYVKHIPEKEAFNLRNIF